VAKSLSAQAELGPASDAQHLAGPRRERSLREKLKRSIDWHLDRTLLNRRQWFGLSELLEHCKLHDPRPDLQRNFKELLRAGILRGDFGSYGDVKSPVTHIWCNTSEPHFPKRSFRIWLPLNSAALNAFFDSIIDDLLIHRTDALAFLNGVCIPPPVSWGMIAPQKVDLVSYRPLKTKTKRKTGPRTGKREAIAKTMLDELK
jgi:hypothetical protein